MTQRVALVTGGSRGIGKAIVERLRLDGLRVLAPTRQQLDLLSNDSVDAYLQSLDEPVDILVNNAGINRLSAATDFTDQDLADTFQINLIAPMRLARALFAGMIQRQYGRIVNISSVWGVVAKAGRMTYAVSKSGLHGFTRILAVEGAPHNVLVNTLAPGFVNTELTRQNNTAQDIEQIRQKIPMQRLAEPEEIARFIAFLCSAENSYLTGQCVVLDGGYTCL